VGLDMNVFRIQKPAIDKGKVYDRDELDGIVLSSEDIVSPMYRQLAPYCVEVRVVNHYYDLKKIGEDYGLEDAHIGGWSCDSNGSSATSIYGKKNGASEHVTIPDELIESKYTIDREETCYVCDRDEVCYWRKAYDIQDWFHKNIPEPVENTGYYVLNEQQIAAFNKEFPEDNILVEAPSETSALVYWEWY